VPPPPTAAGLPQVTQSEGFSKRVLFEMLDGLDKQTRELMVSARATLAKEKGEAALKVRLVGWVGSSTAREALRCMCLLCESGPTFLLACSRRGASLVPAIISARR